MSARLTIAVAAASAADAQESARVWAKAEPRLRLRTVCSVRPRPAEATDVDDYWGLPQWLVELAVEHLTEEPA